MSRYYVLVEQDGASSGMPFAGTICEQGKAAVRILRALDDRPFQTAVPEVTSDSDIQATRHFVSQHLFA